MSKIKCFSCQKTGHYASQCLSRKKSKGKTQVVASVEADDFAERFENDFSLVSCLFGIGVSGAWLEDKDAWVVDSGASSHMMGIRSVFLSVPKTDSNCYVRCGSSTIHTSEGGWNYGLPTRVRGFSRGGRSDACPKA